MQIPHATKTPWASFSSGDIFTDAGTETTVVTVVTPPAAQNVCIQKGPLLQLSEVGSC